MKKFLLSLAIVGMLFVAMPVHALSEADLAAKFKKSFKVGNDTVSIDSDTKVLVERYLNTYEVSEEDCEYIANKIDEAISILQKDGHYEVSKMSTSTKDKLKALVTDVSSHTNVKGTTKKGAVVIYKPNSTETFAEVTRLVKQTGNETNTIAIVASVALLITVAGACLVVRQVKSN